jgi:hypothetical protein
LVDGIETAYGKRLHRKARTEFRKFWSDYRCWVAFASAFVTPVLLQIVRHGWRSLLNIDETLTSGFVGLALSLAGTYVIAMRKGAEILDTEQRSRTTAAEAENQRLNSVLNDKPKQVSVLDQHRFEIVKAATATLGAEAIQTLRHLRAIGKITLGYEEPSIPVGIGNDRVRDILQGLKAHGVIDEEEVGPPPASTGSHPERLTDHTLRSLRTKHVYRIAPEMEKAVDELLGAENPKEYPAPSRHYT